MRAPHSAGNQAGTSNRGAAKRVSSLIPCTRAPGRPVRHSVDAERTPGSAPAPSAWPSSLKRSEPGPSLYGSGMAVADLGTSIHGLTGHSAAVDAMMRVLAGYVIYGAVVVLGLLWFHRDGLRVGVAFALGALVALGIGAGLGSLWVEQRPFAADHFAPLVAHGTDGSFPSDHLLVLGALTGACWVRARPLSVVALALAVLVAVGRVFVGLHYPIDVAAGFGIGALCGLGGWFACRPAMPVLDRLDRQLSRWRVRPVVFSGDASGQQPHQGR